MKKIILVSAILLSLNLQASGLEEIFGNSENGDSCASDYQCQSLCCDSSAGTCKTHEPGRNLWCNKLAGQSCITNEFCHSSTITVCKIVKIAKADGTPSCIRRCDPEEIRGSCIKNRCVSPTNPPIPHLDPDNPDCNEAI